MCVCVCVFVCVREREKERCAYIAEVITPPIKEEPTKAEKNSCIHIYIYIHIYIHTHTYTLTNWKVTDHSNWSSCHHAILFCANPPGYGMKRTTPNTNRFVYESILSLSMRQVVNMSWRLLLFAYVLFCVSASAEKEASFCLEKKSKR